MFPIKVAKKIWNAITAILVVICVVVAILLVGVRALGFGVYTVLSGSMEPTYHTGSIIYTKSVDPESIKAGDPITFVMNDQGLVGTHRVVSVDYEKGCYYTKGDANDTADGAPVLFENLLGKPVFSIPYMGYVADFVQNPPGTYIVVAGGCVLLLLIFMSDLVFGPDEKKKKKGEPQVDALPQEPDEPAQAQEEAPVEAPAQDEQE